VTPQGAIVAGTLAVSVDGALLAFATADEVVLLAAADGVTRASFDPEVAVRAVAFTPNPDRLLLGATNGTISLWDVPSGFELSRQVILTDTGRSNRVLALAPAIGAPRVYAGLEDGTVRLRLAEPTVADVVVWTEANRHLRPFTCGELRFYGLPLGADCAAG
jgi:WD40 repeat protein